LEPWKRADGVEAIADGVELFGLHTSKAWLVQSERAKGASIQARLV